MLQRKNSDLHGHKQLTRRKLHGAPQQTRTNHNGIKRPSRTRRDPSRISLLGPHQVQNHQTSPHGKHRLLNRRTNPHGPQKKIDYGQEGTKVHQTTHGRRKPCQKILGKRRVPEVVSLIVTSEITWILAGGQILIEGHIAGTLTIGLRVGSVNS